MHSYSNTEYRQADLYSMHSGMQCVPGPNMYSPKVNVQAKAIMTTGWQIYIADAFAVRSLPKHVQMYKSKYSLMVNVHCTG